MLFTIILFASLALAKITKNRHTEPASIVNQFPWVSMSEETGIDPFMYLKPIAESTPETLACTTVRTPLILEEDPFTTLEYVTNIKQKPGPDRVACPAAIAGWFDLVDENRKIKIEGGQCRSVTDGTCRTVACAPLGDIVVSLEEVTGYMWKPVSSRCVFGGTGGIWQNKGSTLVIEMGYEKE